MRCILCVAVGAWVAMVPAQADPAAHWRLDETSGTVASDSSPNANDGTLVGFTGQPWTNGFHGGALTFAGGQYVTCALNGGLPAYDAAGGPFTITAWVNGPPQEDTRFYSEGSSASNSPLYTLGTGRISLGTGDRFHLFVRNDANTPLANTSSTSVVFDNTWHHVAVVDAGGSVTVYIDGVPEAVNFSYSISGTHTGVDRVSLGAVLRATACCYFNGLIDDVRVYPFALSATAVATVLADGPLSAEYQLNSPASTFVVDGVPDPGPFLPMSVIRPLATTALVDFTSTNVGMPWDVGFTAAAPAIPASVGAVLTPGNQLINIDLTDPSYVSLFGLGFSNTFANLTGVAVTAPGPATTAGQLAVVDPTGPDGIALSHANQVSFVPCANPQSFDTATGGGPAGYPLCWTDGGGTYSWQVNSGGTPSANTGPTGDNTTGMGNYMYCETSAPALVGDTYILNAPPSQATGGGVQFAYHMYGGTMGTLELQELQGGTWTTIWSLSGDQGPMWLTTPIVPVTQNPTSLRFLYTRGNSFTGDCAIDDYLLL